MAKNLLGKKEEEKNKVNPSTLRIRAINFENHYFFKNLCIDLTDKDSNPVDTIIIAGENGTGKTTILNEIYKTMTPGNYGDKHAILTIQKENNIEQFPVLYENNTIFPFNHSLDNIKIFKKSFPRYKLDLYDIKVIYSTTNINFNTNEIRNVTSKTLDEKIYNKITEENTANILQQMFIDIYTQDSLELNYLYQKYKKNIPDEEIKNKVNGITRFTRAFNIMFNDLKFSTIRNYNGRKQIIFERNGQEIDINDLSSGEKQIVYRGLFLLQDKNSLYGAIVLIDEPEISLHPTWQSKIVDYYKQIFTDDNNIQTSQLIIVTHSPFIIHGENRYNDKVIVLKKKNNEIIVTNNATFPSWNNNIAIQQAFNINLIPINKHIIFIEGITDKNYFNKALEVFEYKNINFQFDIPGEYTNNKNIDNGESGLYRAYTVLRHRKNTNKYIFLYDVDVNIKQKGENTDTCIILKMEQYNNSKNITKGIENLLILPENINLSNFHSSKQINNGTGITYSTYHLDKIKLCDYICNLNNEQLKDVFTNLKKEIDRIIEILEK